jgi:glycosyltransferase involved in cell wall biosynthesis
MQQQEKEKISIIGQCYNEEEALPLYYEAMCRLMDKMDYVDFELIFVDDCSKDQSLAVIKDLAKKDKRVHYISMSRNFGKDACAMAGFRYATGNYIATMDLDLQDPPELLVDMYSSIKNKGYDIAAAKALTRKGYSFIHKLCINTFYSISNGISSVKMIDGQRDYRLMTRQVVEAILLHNEYDLFNKALLNDVGFKTKWICYEYGDRSVGNTKFPYKRLMKYAVNGLLAYSVVPLVAISLLGFVMVFLTVLAMAVMLFSGSVSDFGIGITLLLMMNTLIIFCMGIMALYISQIHREVKRRPRYIVRETDIIMV